MIRGNSMFVATVSTTVSMLFCVALLTALFLPTRATACEKDDECAAGQVCWDAECCAPDCADKTCGYDGCGKKAGCGTCAVGTYCLNFSCQANKCNKGFIPDCEGDCADEKLLGDGFCDDVVEPIWINYKCPELAYDAGDCKVCVPDCKDKECGDDGCGGNCGKCKTGFMCDGGGKCIAGCAPDCDGKTCGDDGCGGICGTCPVGQYCFLYECKVSTCGESEIPDCDGACKTLDWYGDGICDDLGSDFTANFNCEELAWDLGDCQGCVPDCFAKECGDDGCDGSCGECAAGEACDAGECVTGCVADCTGKFCGWDGCLGSCAECAAGQYCFAYACVENPCGGGKMPDCDGNCKDVNWYGDLLCDNVSGVSYLANFACDELGWDLGTCEPCEKDCTDKACGADGCGGLCGECLELEVCLDGACAAACLEDQIADCYEECRKLDWLGDGICDEGFNCELLGFDEGDCLECVPDCEGKECGPDGCGGWCAECGSAETYCKDFLCVENPCDAALIPDCTGACVSVEVYGDGWCDDETSPFGNFACPELFYDLGDCCVPDCGEAECGDDGCGGSCGECDAGFECTVGKCEQTCVPDCTDLECGDDGCGGSCGECADGIECQGGKCAEICVPDCTDLECGDDGCGGSCGECKEHEVCEQGRCVCDSSCDGLECGDDGCGGTCGECTAGFECKEGKCAESCVPACAEKQCGDDGCGGICGTCEDGTVCSETGTCEPVGDGDAAGQEDVLGDGQGKEDGQGEEKKDGGDDGGCTAAGTGSANAPLLGLALLVLALVPRRRSARRPS